MIWESDPWKRALHADTKRLDRLRNHNGMESKLVSIERTIFTAGFSIRKLGEAQKLTDQVSNLHVPCVRYRSCAGGTPNHLNWHHIERFYNMNIIENYLMPLRFFCNMLIHSFIFILINDDFNQKMKKLLITSDHEREKFLYSFEYDAIREAFIKVAKDDVVRLDCQRISNGKIQFSKFGPGET